LYLRKLEFNKSVIL